MPGGLLEVIRLAVEWEVITSGPVDVRNGVLLLPGGANPAVSFEDVMADPSIAGVRLVAATLPGHAGTSRRTTSRWRAMHWTAKLTAAHRCGVVVGFSMGATVALEMAASGLHLRSPPSFGLSRAMAKASMWKLWRWGP
jgi:pimeloyl-ACP methyl ester carboxylesterase